jgi:hypothetical protein
MIHFCDRPSRAGKQAYDRDLGTALWDRSVAMSLIR